MNHLESAVLIHGLAIEEHCKKLNFISDYFSLVALIKREREESGKEEQYLFVNEEGANLVLQDYIDGILSTTEKLVKKVKKDD